VTVAVGRAGGVDAPGSPLAGVAIVEQQR
jgi:hypothetical protein